jgi:NAD-dependent deacetylase
MQAMPNRAHHLIRALEDHYDVTVITQNVDDLHEKANSSKVIHLHGELMKCRSEKNEDLVYSMDHWEIKYGDKAEDGAQLRPHIVWFGEMVPMFEQAAMCVANADMMLVIGTSLLVYPAASLVHYGRKGTSLYLIDPDDVQVYRPNVIHFKKGASDGLEDLYAYLNLALPSP